MGRESAESGDLHKVKKEEGMERLRDIIHLTDTWKTGRGIIWAGVASALTSRVQGSRSSC